MDLLHKRYASPFSFMDGCIATGRLCDFIHTFVQQKIEGDRWEYFLHKVWGDMSYEDFKRNLQSTQNDQRMTAERAEATVKMSQNILKNFNPNVEGGGK